MQKKQSIKGFAEVNDARLFYEIQGEGHPLVLIHGGLVDNRMWDDQFTAFAKNYKVIRYDVRGHGNSAIPSEPFSHVNDLYGLLEYLGIKKAYLVGLSMGGAIAIDFAIQYPEIVSALVPVTSALIGYNYSEEFMAKGEELFLAGKEKGLSQLVKTLFAEPFWAYTIPSERNQARQKFRQMVKENSSIVQWNPNLIKFIDPPAAKRLSEIECPTLIITTDKDYSENQAVAHLLESEISSAEKVLISDAGHMVNMEKPDEFNRIVLDFLSHL